MPGASNGARHSMEEVKRVDNVQLEVSSAGGLFPFPPSTEAERRRSCSVGWAISLLIEGNTQPYW
jgi:hypothetical protein